jgi:hypothetical protein
MPTSRAFHNDVKMLAAGIRQGFRNVIPRFQLFTVRDIAHYLDRLEEI